MKEYINDIVNVSRNIFNRGLVSGKAGNISLRLNDVIGITPTLKSLADLKNEDIVLVDLDGNVLSNGKPSSEVNMHLEIYKKRDDINAIVHTHSPYATGFSFSKKELKRLEGFGEIKNPYIASIDYEKPGTYELAKKASDALINEDVIILKNHGVICVGKNLKEAESFSYFIEESAKTQFVTYMLNFNEE